MPVISNHRQQALERLLEQYKDRPKLKGLMSGLVNPLQEIEEELTKLESERWLDEAEGLQLDHLGKIVGELRNNRGDEEYRMAIYTRIFLNRGGGTPEDIIAALDLVYRPERIEYSELYPASFQVYVQGYDRLKGIKTLVESIKPAGVGNVIITQLQENEPFVCSGITVEKAVLNISDETNGSLNLHEEGGQDHTLEIAADTILQPDNGLGFAGIIINECNLEVANGGVYMIDDSTPLSLVASLEDFKVYGGGRLTGVIEND